MRKSEGDCLDSPPLGRPARGSLRRHLPALLRPREAARAGTRLSPPSPASRPRRAAPLGSRLRLRTPPRSFANARLLRGLLGGRRLAPRLPAPAREMFGGRRRALRRGKLGQRFHLEGLPSAATPRELISAVWRPVVIPGRQALSGGWQSYTTPRSCRAGGATGAELLGRAGLKNCILSVLSPLPPYLKRKALEEWSTPVNRDDGGGERVLLCTLTGE